MVTGMDAVAHERCQSQHSARECRAWDRERTHVPRTRGAARRTAHEETLGVRTEGADTEAEERKLPRLPCLGG